MVPWSRALNLFKLLWKRQPAAAVGVFYGLPFILLAQYSAVIGEAVGMIAGIGNAEILFTQTHLRGLRILPELPEQPKS